MAELDNEDEEKEVDVKEVVARLTALEAENAKLRNATRAQPITQQQSQQRISHTQAERQRLIGLGHDADAVDIIIGIQEAKFKDANEQAVVHGQAVTAKQVENLYWKASLNAVESLAEKIPALANMNNRVAEMLKVRVSDEVQDNPEFKSILTDMNQWKEPNTRLIGKVAAKVIDKYLEEIGQTKERSPLAVVPSGKPSATRSSTQSGDPKSLSIRGRKLYHEQMRVLRGKEKNNKTEDHQKAFALAIKHDKEMQYA
jgi:hypothetical protein